MWVDMGDLPPLYPQDFYLKIHDKDLTNESFYTLCQFTKKDLHVYQLWNILKSTDYKTDKKNVFTKVKTFRSLGLIEETKKVGLENLHKAIYYRLTSAGIFCIFYHLRGKSLFLFSDLEKSDIIKGLLKNHKDDEFFSLFVYPYFEKRTLLKLKSSIVLKFLLAYCSEIAYRMFSIVFEDMEIVNYSNDENNTKEGNKDSNYVKNPEKIKVFLADLIDKREKEQSNSEVQTIPPHVTFGKKKQLYHRNSREENNSFNEYLTSQLKIESSSIIENSMILNIIGEGKYWPGNMHNYYNPYDFKHWESIEGDIVLLVNDKKFYAVLERTKDAIVKCYNDILRFRQQGIPLN